MSRARTLLIDAAVNDKVRFTEEKMAYTVQARSKRYLVCTKPFNPRHTVLYTIVDLKEDVRGAENLILGAGAETRAKCEEMLGRLTDPDHPTEVSHRNRVALDVKDFIKGEGRYCGFCHRGRKDGVCSMCEGGGPIS